MTVVYEHVRLVPVRELVYELFGRFLGNGAQNEAGEEKGLLDNNKDLDL